MEEERVNGLHWEELHSTGPLGPGDLRCFRAKVEGGWLMLTKGREFVAGLTFLPDREQKWKCAVVEER